MQSWVLSSIRSNVSTISTLRFVNGSQHSSARIHSEQKEQKKGFHPSIKLQSHLTAIVHRVGMHTSQSKNMNYRTILFDDKFITSNRHIKYHLNSYASLHCVAFNWNNSIRIRSRSFELAKKVSRRMYLKYSPTRCYFFFLVLLKNNNLRCRVTLFIAKFGHRPPTITFISFRKIRKGLT